MLPAHTPHFGERHPTMIVLHGTELDDAASRAVFEGKTQVQASCHYYINAKGELLHYVDEGKRAWHAGVSYWAGFTDINSMSIGIELEAISYSRKFDGDETAYTQPQMLSLVALIKDIRARHNIAPWNIVGHQDIACTRPFEPTPAADLDHMLATQDVSQQRKYDPGKSFDWRFLAENGIGLWHDLTPVANDPEITDSDIIEWFYQSLACYGYDMRQNGAEQGFEHVIRAFQTHFLPWNICGKVTEQSMIAINRLLGLKQA